MEYKHATRIYKNVDENGNKLKPYIVNYTIFLKEGKVVGVNSWNELGDYPTSINERSETFAYFKELYETF